jgi:hypothetical protein
MTVHLATEDVVVEHHADDLEAATASEPHAYIEPYVPSPVVSKYDRRASGVRTEAPSDVAPQVAADPTDSTSKAVVAAADGLTPVSSAEPPPEPEAVTPEYVEPYVPAPIWNKYDRRASGAMSKSPRASEAAASEAADDDATDEVDAPAANPVVGKTAASPDPEEAPEPGTPAASSPSAAEEEPAIESITVDLTDDGVEPAPVPAAPSIYDRELREIEEREKEARAAAAAAAAAVDPFADSDGLTYWQRHSARLPRIEDQDD